MSLKRKTLNNKTDAALFSAASVFILLAGGKNLLFVISYARIIKLHCFGRCLGAFGEDVSGEKTADEAGNDLVNTGAAGKEYEP